MTKKYLVFFATILMVFSGCTTVPTTDIRFEAEADPKARFSGYKTYAWVGSAAILNDPHGQWEPLGFDADSEIRYLINRELRKRGMSENTVAPDLYIAFAAGIDMAALGLKQAPDTQIKILANVPQGGLVVVLVDSDSGFVIWAGVAAAEIQQNADNNTVKARLDYAVTKLLKRIPK